MFMKLHKKYVSYNCRVILRFTVYDDLALHSFYVKIEMRVLVYIYRILYALCINIKYNITEVLS